MQSKIQRTFRYQTPPLNFSPLRHHHACLPDLIWLVYGSAAQPGTPYSGAGLLLISSAHTTVHARDLTKKVKPGGRKAPLYIIRAAFHATPSQVTKYLNPKL
jgi:hypothetical protein